MAYRGKKIVVVVPAHNEARLIGKVINGMPDFVDRIVVVDDRSTDDTAKRVNAFVDNRLTLLRHTARRGVGGAIESGYREALGWGADIIGVMAGDAQMDPRDLSSLLEPLIDRRADYTKGNRLMKPELYESMPRLRRYGNRILGLLTRIAIMRWNIHDPQCGYTAINSSTLEDLLRLPVTNGYGYPNEILCNLAILGKRILEVPVRAVYGDESSGIRIPSYAIKMSFILTRCLLRRLRH